MPLEALLYLKLYMKNTRKQTILFLAIIFILFSCKSFNKGESKIIGKWKVEDRENRCEELILNNNYSLIFLQTDKDIFELTTNALIISSTSNLIKDTFSYKINKDSLIWDYGVDKLNLMSNTHFDFISRGRLILQNKIKENKNCLYTVILEKIE